MLTSPVFNCTFVALVQKKSDFFFRESDPGSGVSNLNCQISFLLPFKGLSLQQLFSKIWQFKWSLVLSWPQNADKSWKVRMKIYREITGQLIYGSAPLILRKFARFESILNKILIFLIIHVLLPGSLYQQAPCQRQNTMISIT